jgi:hypothetical protein
LRKETVVDVLKFVQHLQAMDDVLVAAVVIAMFSYMAYPDVKRVVSRMLVKASERSKHDRGYRG